MLFVGGLLLGFVGGWMLASYFAIKLMDAMDEVKASTLVLMDPKVRRSAVHWPSTTRSA